MAESIRQPANPDAPEFTPDAWNENPEIVHNSPEDAKVVPGANCFQYAVAGSDKNGKNNVFYEPEDAIPNPGETTGRVQDNSHDITLLNSLGVDGFPILSKSEVPPAKPGYYVIGIFLHEGKDYHFVRQDRDGGWSSKPGVDNPVERYLEPAADGTYQPLHGRFGQGDYIFQGYTYARKEGVAVGLRIALEQSLKDIPDGSGISPLFKSRNKDTIDQIRQSFVKHDSAEIIHRFDEARLKYTPVANKDAPLFDPLQWNQHSTHTEFNIT